MAATKRAQVMMEPEEYRRLAAISRRMKLSVSELVRRAVRLQYFAEEPDRKEAARRILEMNLPAVDWPKAESIIEDAHGSTDLP